MKLLSSIYTKAGCNPQTGPIAAASVSHVGASFRAGAVLASLAVACGLVGHFAEVTP